MKKMLCFIMSLIIIATFSISTNAVAFDDTDKLTVTGSHSEEDLFCDNFYYHFLDDRTIEISYYDGNESIVNIPEIIDGYQVTSIGQLALAYSYFSIKEIVIPESVTNIESGAFTNTGIKKLFIPKGVSRINGDIVEGCSELEKIKVDENNEYYCDIDGVLYNIDKTDLIRFPLARTGSYSIPDGVKGLSGISFHGCQIESVTMPIGATLYWPGGQFAGCTNLKSITLNSGVDGIGWGDFDGCELLEKIEIPDSVTWIDAGSFYGCFSLQRIDVDENNPKYFSVDGVVYNKNKTELVAVPKTFSGKYSIPDGVVSIGECAFVDCKYLTEVVIPEGVERIERSAFQNCDNLSAVYLPRSIESIDYENGWDNTFGYDRNDNKIAGFTIYGYTGTVAEAYAVEQGFDFVSLGEGQGEYNGFIFHYLENGNIKITDYVKGDKEITIPEKINNHNVTELGNKIFFEDDTVETINIGESVNSFSVQQCKNLKNINVKNGNQSYFSVSGVLFSKATKEMIVYPKNNSTQTLTIPEGIEKLSGIESAELKTLNLPSTVVSFGDLNCENLEAINVNRNSSTYCSIDGVLYNKSVSEMLYYPWGNSMVDYHIPDTVTTLKGELGGTPYTANNRFGNGTKYLKNIYVPKSVTDFGRYPFTLCGDCIENIFVDSDNAVYHSENGILYENNSVIAYPQNNRTKDFHIPEGTNGLSGTFYLSGCHYVENVYMPASLTKFNFGLFEFCESLKNIYVAESNPDFCDIDGVLYNKQKTRLICYPRGRKDAVIVLPDGTEELDYCSFYQCNQITGVVIPHSLKQLNGGAFVQCQNLRDFTFTRDIQSISGIGYVLGGGPGAGGWRIGDIENVTIRGYSGTVAESYARDNGFTFISLGKVDRLLGDSDGDDSVTIVDATVIQRHLAEIPTAVYIEAAADTDQDGNVTILDATCIQRWLAELPTHEGIGKVFV